MENFDVRSIFFKIIDWRTAMQIYRKEIERSGELYILHEDMSESLIESESEIISTNAVIGEPRSEMEVAKNKIIFYEMVYSELGIIRNTLTEFTTENDNHAKLIEKIDVLQKNIAYVECLGN